MEFLNKTNRTADIPKFTSDDIIKSVANIITDRHYYAEERVAQAKSLELYVEDGKYFVEDIKSGQKLHIPALTPQVKAIIDKYFSLHQDPVDLLISGNGDVLKINPEGNFEPEEVSTLKTEIKKSNLWRLTNAQKPEKMQQQPINEEETEYNKADNNQIDAIVNAVEHFVSRGGSVSKIAYDLIDSIWEGLEESLEEDPAKLEAIVTFMVKSLRDYLQDYKKNIKSF